jgi:hypothetical protein
MIEWLVPGPFPGDAAAHALRRQLRQVWVPEILDTDFRKF